MTLEGLTTLPDVEAPSNPFPGLRPFEFHESHLYFGRDGQSDQLIRKLNATRFVAVVGTSGSGKSSLVRAGLLPDLYSGYMSGAGSHWRVCVMRPGNDPLGNLARALSGPGVFGPDAGDDAPMLATIAEATLRRGGLGLVEAVRQHRMAPNESLLVVVDQFEELFRFARVAGSEQYRYEAAAFVKLLLEAARQREHAVYVVLTMRSDFLGDCSQFWDLPEAINEGQYLVPRMTRDQRTEAIAGPVAVCGGRISQRLVNRLLNDTGDNPDMLPILQHALMRTWERWEEDHAEGEPVDLRHYEAVGTMAEALSRHADEAYAELPDDRARTLAEKVFKALTEKGEDNREIRRPTGLKQLCALAGATPAEVVPIVEVFRREGRSFLMPPAPVPLDEDSLIDISHESLIRNWGRLKAWVDEESASAQVYVRLAETAVLHGQGRAGLWRDPDLQVGLDWRERSGPVAAWATRYHPAFDSAMSFLDASVEARDTALLAEERRRRREVRRTRLAAIVFFFLFMLSLAASGYAYNQSILAEEKSRAAEEAKLEAVAQRAEAETSRRRAEQEAEHARLSAIRAEEKTKEAEESKVYAERQAEIAKENELIAGEAREEALAKSKEAERQARIARANADQAVREAEKNRQLAYASDINLSQRAYDDDDIEQGVRLISTYTPAAGKPASAPAERPGFEWYYLWRLYHGFQASLTDEPVASEGAGGEPAAEESQCRSAAHFVAFSPGGDWLAYAGCRSVTLRNAASNRVERFASPHRISSIAIAPDAKTIASGHDKVVNIWEAGRRAPVFTLRGHGREVIAAAFSPDGKRLVTGGADNKALLWDTAAYEAEPVALPGHTAYVKAVAFSPDGQTLATGSGGSVRLWEVATRRLLDQLPWRDGMVQAMIFSPDGKSLVVSYKDGYVKEWNLPSRESRDLLPKQPRDINSLSLSPGGVLATGSSDAAVRLWDVASQTGLATLKRHTDAVSSVSFSPDGRTLATAGMDGRVLLWDSGSQIRMQSPLKGHGSFVTAVAFSPDGALIASGGGGRDRTVRLWDARTHQTLKALPAQKEDIAALAFSPDGRLLAVGTEKSGDNVLVWDTASPDEGPLTLSGHTDIVNSLAFSSDGKLLATAGRDRTVRLWDVASCRVSCKEPVLLSGFDRSVLSVAFSPDGALLAAGDGSGRLTLWDAARCAGAGGCAEPLLRTDAAADSRTVVAFSPDGRLLAFSRDGSITLWDAATRKVQREWSGHKSAFNSLAFSPDGKTLVGSDGSAVRMWSTNSFRELIKFDGDPTQPFTSVAFSRDGKTLAAGSYDGTVKLWHAAADEEVTAKLSMGSR